MKKISILLMLMALFGPLAMMGQGTLTIGTGTNYSGSGSGTSSATNYGAGSPMGNTYYYYSTAQFIYLASEMEGAKTINSLAFYHNNAGAFNATVKIYLAHTSSSTVSTSSPATSGTLVYTGTNMSVGGSSAGWQTFTLETPFEYNGTDNLMVIVCRTKGTTSPTYQSSLGWQYSTISGSYRFMQRSADTQNYDVISNTSYSYTASYYRPNIQIGYTTSGGSCASGCECFENCTALTSTSSGSSGSTPAANLPSGWKGYGADYYPFAATFNSYMGSSSDGQFMYFKATDSNATYLALPDQYVTQVNFDYAYETDTYGDVLFLEIGYMTDISSSTWYNNTFYSLKTMTNNGDTWGSETQDFSSVTASTYYVVFKFSQNKGSWYSAAIDNVCLTTNAPDPCDKTLPYTYGFEDATDYNNCWTNSNLETCSNNNSMGGGVYTSSSYANNGSKLFIFSSYCGETDPQYLISPKLRGVQNGVHVEFDYATADFANAPETFQVGYSTTTNSVSSFTWVDSRTCTSSTYEHFSANYMGNVKYVAVKYTTSDSYYLFLDDFIIEEAPNCLEPTNVVASNETTTSANIGWTAGGSETEWDLYYTSNPSDVPTASTTPSISGITTNSRNLTSLTAATTYYVYVRAACSSTETSAWSTPGIFNTECYEMALPYSYGFEDGALSVCWTAINESVVYMSSGVVNTNPRTGNYHFNFDLRTPNGTQIIVLPEVDATYALSNYEVSFYAMLATNSNSSSTAANRTLTVGIMTDPDDASTFVAVGSAVTPGTSYAKYTFDLSSYTGSGHYIAIKHAQTESGNNGNTYIDDLEITALPCPVPSGLSATNITAASATLGWTGDQSYYNVRYRSYEQGEPQNNVFEEGFEGGSMPSGWDNSNHTGTTSWNIGAGTGHTSNSIAATTTSATGSYNAYYYSASSSGSAYLILPALDLSNASVATLTFNYVNPAWAGGYYSLTVYYRVNGGSWNQLDQYTTSQDTWTGKTVTLTGFDSNYEVAFYVTGYNSDYGHGVGIDDVRIEYTAQTVTYGTWEYKTNQATPLTITGLTPMTTYQWQVQGIDGSCSGDGEGNTGVTGWSNVATFTTGEGYVLHVDSWSSKEWYLIASPIGTVNPTNVLNMISDNLGNTASTSTATYDLYAFNQTQSLEWQNYRNGAFNLAAGQGYLYASKNGADLVFAGSAYTGTGTFYLTYSTDNSEAYMHGWNLLGNPYPVSATISESFDFMEMRDDHSDFIVGDGTVEAMEGIFVHATVTGQSVTFTPNPAKTTNVDRIMINISQDQKVIDRAIVRFGEGHQMPKFQLNENSTKIYFPVDGEDFAVVRSEGIGELPVSFKAEENGNYTLSLNAEGVSFGYLHLIDNMTGNDVDMLVNPSYSFESRTSDYSHRFKLVFATGDNTNDTFAYFSNGSFVINNDGNATLQVIDVTGRILKSESINGCANLNFNAVPGVYMLRLVNGTDVKVQKVVVR